MKLSKSQFFPPKPPTTVGNELDEMAPKTLGNELDEMTGPINKEGRDPDGTNPDLAAKARKTFF